jgi:hypothetical protein
MPVQGQVSALPEANAAVDLLQYMLDMIVLHAVWFWLSSLQLRLSPTQELLKVLSSVENGNIAWCKGLLERQVKLVWPRSCSVRVLGSRLV